MPAPQSQAIHTRSPSTPAVQLAAAAVLLHEGVEGGEYVRHHGCGVMAAMAIVPLGCPFG